MEPEEDAVPREKLIICSTPMGGKFFTLSIDPLPGSYLANFPDGEPDLKYTLPSDFKRNGWWW